MRSRSSTRSSRAFASRVAEVRLSAAERADFEDIREYGVEQFGETVAERHLVGLREALALLAEHPRVGPARPEFRQDIRSLPHRPHRILDTVAGDVVSVLRIVHQARDVPAALDEAQ